MCFILFIILFIILLLYFIGTIPQSLCNVTLLNALNIGNGVNDNPGIACSLDCLTTIPNKLLPSLICHDPTSQEIALCSFIAATNIASKSGYNEWSCTSAGITKTDPCSSPIWSGLSCSSGSIVSINLYYVHISGMI